MMFTSSKKTFSVLQSRIYNIHVPRKVVFGVNIIKKLLKLSITRPTVDNPAQSRMHAQTIVTAKNNKIGEATSEYDEVKKYCPQCKSRVIVSRGKLHLLFT